MTMMMITIPVDEYFDLLERNEKLEALEQCGVDNWEGYGDAMDLWTSWADEEALD